MNTNLVVADMSRTDKTICLAVTPSLKSFGIPGRPRMFEVKSRLKTVNEERRRIIGGHIHDTTLDAFDQLTDRQPILSGQLHHLRFCITEPGLIKNVLGSFIRQPFDKRQMQKGSTPGNQVYSSYISKFQFVA